MTNLIERLVTRYLCPHCRRGFMKSRAARDHLARCSRNPTNLSCRTCQRYCAPVKARTLDNYTWEPGEPESCLEGINIQKHRDSFGCYPIGCSAYISDKEPEA